LATITASDHEESARQGARRRSVWAWLAVAASSCGALGALWQLSLLLRQWAARVSYPFDIEWLEGQWLYQAYRVMHGLPTYGPLRGGYLAPNHPPLYPAVLALVGRVAGLDYPMARTFSLACFFGAAALVVSGCLRRYGKGARGWGLSALAVGCAAASSPLCLDFFDLVREDAMALFLSVACAALVAGGRKLSTWRVVLVAAVITAMVYTRLPIVFFAVWAIVFVGARHPRSGVTLAVVTTAMCGLVLAGLMFMSRGWYWVLTVGLVQDHAIRSERFLPALQMFFAFAPFLPALPLLAIGLAVARRLSSDGVLWTGMLIAALPASLLPWAKLGGFENDFLPVAFLIGPAAAFLIGDLLVALDAAPRVGAAVHGIFMLAGAGFLVSRTWDPTRFTPTPEMRRGAEALNARVAALQGGAVAPRHPFLPARNGHTTLGWSDMPYLDMLWSGYTDLDLGPYIDRAHARYALIFGNEIAITSRELSFRYQLDSRVNDAPLTIIGDPSSIRYVLRANDDETGGHVVFDFESLDGWTGSPGIFTVAPTRPAWQLPIEGAVGPHVADSYTRPGSDVVMGTIVSPPFRIDRPHMSVRVGGGTRPSTRVELRVQGRPERTATSIWYEQETLTRVVWDVSAFQGQEAQLALVDQDWGSWGHLTCDHVVLY
jgi:hypothetical protein